MRVEGDQAIARVGDSESFPFSFEHLGFVGCGLGYQAWGPSSHFAFRQAPNGVVVEFQGPGQRGAATVYLSDEGLRNVIDALNVYASSGRASLR